MNMSIAEYKAFQEKRKIGKYRNKRTLIDEIWFDSKLEADRYLELKALQKAGAISFILVQVPFRLPGGLIYRCDFLRVNSLAYIAAGGPPVEVEDCKGTRTRVSINKIKQVEAIYKIKVQIITRKKR